MSGDSRNSVKSCPAQNPRPAPVITTARISGSAASASASASAAWSAALKALNTSGRLSVIVSTAPSRASSTSAISASLRPFEERLDRALRLVAEHRQREPVACVADRLVPRDVAPPVELLLRVPGRLRQLSHELLDDLVHLRVELRRRH